MSAAWVSIPQYKTKTVHVFGAFDGATVRMFGNRDSSDVSDGAGFQMHDPQGNVVALTSPGVAKLLENPLYIRPDMINVGAGTLVTIILVAIATPNP